MSTATLTPPAAPAFDAAAFVRSLPPEAQEAVLVELVREVLRVNGPCGPLPIVAADGEFLGCYQSPAAVDAQLRELGLDLEASDKRLKECLADPDATFTFAEFLAEEWAGGPARPRSPVPEPVSASTPLGGPV